ncbi:MAG: type II toxin-antitoxin system RelE/ParE family toxin [Planctomycetota bacterium]|jgi:phage-related protein
MDREIRFYRTESGNCPVEQFIDSLKGKQAQKVTWVLNLIEILDTIPSRYFKKLADTEDLWEARIGFGSDTFRLLGFFDGNMLVVFVHGFKKKSQKLSKQAVALAHERKKDYFRRKNHE